MWMDAWTICKRNQCEGLTRYRFKLLNTRSLPSAPIHAKGLIRLSQNCTHFGWETDHLCMLFSIANHHVGMWIRRLYEKKNSFSSLNLLKYKNLFNFLLKLLHDLNKYIGYFLNKKIIYIKVQYKVGSHRWRWVSNKKNPCGHLDRKWLIKIDTTWIR